MFDSYIAIGDSFTEGLEDHRPDGSMRGWADMVAAQLAQHQGSISYLNLGVRGRKLAGVVDDQVPVVEALRPSLVTVGAGGNDVLRLSSAVDALAQGFDAMLARLVAASGTVLAFAGFDPRRRIPFTRIPGRRADAFNIAIRESARQRGALLVDLWSMPRIYEDRMWAPDRLHLSSDGHVLVAEAVLARLGVAVPFEALARSAGVPVSWRPPPVTRLEDARWFAQDVIPWAYRGMRGRSSGDGRAAKHAGYVVLERT